MKIEIAVYGKNLEKFIRAMKNTLENQKILQLNGFFSQTSDFLEA